MRVLPLLLLAGLVLGQDTSEIWLVRVATGLTSPVDIQSAKDSSKRLFVVQQNGVIRMMRDGQLAAQPFLDIRTRTRSSGECGLLGVAFPPGFASKRHFYVNYTTTNCSNSIVARYRLTAGDDNLADSASEEIVLQQAQPFSNHNGGQIQFGPDGFLYIGFGDGGSGGDPQNNAQNPGTWLGKMLRIDTESSERPYKVPDGNPFVSSSSYKPEIWGTGLRNPWRFSFDRDNRELWIADVGQNRAEEINWQSSLSTGGENYGWRVMEGFACYNPSSGCNRNNLTQPVFEYTRNQGDVSVTGGYVYRGARWAGLRGTYVYGDYASGRIWGIRREGPNVSNRLLRASGLTISTFGEDDDGELYVADHGGGAIYRLESSQTPQLTSRSVVNAASFDVGLTPGSAASLFASAITDAQAVTSAQSKPLPRQIANVRVRVNGQDAPLYAVANVNGQEQVNFQAPFDLIGPNARVSVQFGAATSEEVQVPVAEFQPGIFASGSFGIVVRSADNTLVTEARPARAGELVYFYATGLGPVTNTPAAGAASPGGPVAEVRTVPEVRLGADRCEVLFAGLAPGFVGIYQVNVRLPARVQAGLLNLTISAGGSTSREVRVPLQ